MTSSRLLTASIACSAMAIAGAARAETAAAGNVVFSAPGAAPLMAKVDTSRIRPMNLASRRIFISATAAQTGPAIPAGTVKTAIDRQFGSQNVAALGYLCGLQPGPNEAGGPASGYDAMGTFLGAQLKLAFR